MTTARHVIFGTGAIGLATLDTLRRRGETVRLVNRSGHGVVGGEQFTRHPRVGHHSGIRPALIPKVQEGAARPGA